MAHTVGSKIAMDALFRLSRELARTKKARTHFISEKGLRRRCRVHSDRLRLPEVVVVVVFRDHCRQGGAVNLDILTATVLRKICERPNRKTLKLIFYNIFLNPIIALLSNVPRIFSHGSCRSKSLH